MRKSKVSSPYANCTDHYEVAQEVIRNNFLPNKSRQLHAAIKLATEECIKLGYDQKESYNAAAEFAELYCCSHCVR
jgi:hypothetical protein